MVKLTKDNKQNSLYFYKYFSLKNVTTTTTTTTNNNNNNVYFNIYAKFKEN